jgi:hypothetical protein
MLNTPSDITLDKKIEHETWNTCPFCGDSWRDINPTIGLIHRTRLCKKCKEAISGDDRKDVSKIDSEI